MNSRKPGWMVFSFFSKQIRLSAHNLFWPAKIADKGYTAVKLENQTRTEELAEQQHFAASALEGLSFCYPFRKYQQEIIELVKLKLEKGERQLHIVAPPGAGKTIIGLQLIAELKQPSLV